MEKYFMVVSNENYDHQKRLFLPQKWKSLYSILFWYDFFSVVRNKISFKYTLHFYPLSSICEMDRSKIHFVIRKCTVIVASSQKYLFLKCFDIKRHDYTKINHRMKNYYFCCNYHVSLLEVHIRKPCMKMNKLRFK